MVHPGYFLFPTLLPGRLVEPAPSPQKFGLIFSQALGRVPRPQKVRRHMTHIYMILMYCTFLRTLIIGSASDLVIHFGSKTLANNK